MSGDVFRSAAKGLLGALASQLSFRQAVVFSKFLLQAQGFGAGGAMAESGELAVIGRVNGSAPVLFDVGGHSGEYAEAFLARHPGGRALVFEPSKAHFDLLSARLGRLSQVQLFECALAAEAGNATLYKDREVSGLASLTRRRLDHFDINMDVTESIRMRTLDEVAEQEEIETIDLLKIDVEGHELSVLNGARRTFARGAVSVVQFEFGGCNLDTRTNLADFYYYFKEYGFKIGLLHPSGSVNWMEFYDEFFEQYRTANFVAVPIEVRP